MWAIKTINMRLIKDSAIENSIIQITYSMQSEICIIQFCLLDTFKCFIRIKVTSTLRTVVSTRTGSCEYIEAFHKLYRGYIFATYIQYLFQISKKNNCVIIPLYWLFHVSNISANELCQVYLRHLGWIPKHDYQNYRLEVLLSKCNNTKMIEANLRSSLDI